MALKELAARRGKSMGQLVREFVEAGLGGRPGGKSLLELRGFIESADVSGRDHDALYDEG